MKKRRRRRRRRRRRGNIIRRVRKAAKKTVRSAKKVATKSTNAVGNAFSKYGRRFVNLYNNFKKMWASKFKMPRLAFSRSIANGISRGVKKITNDVKKLLARVRRSEEFLQLQQDAQWVAGGAYLAVKFGEKHLVKPVVDAFCAVIKVFTNPIKRALNAVMKLVTGILPAWLVKIVAFGGLGALVHQFLCSSFTVGATFAIAHGITADSFEAGFALEFKKNMQIGKTGCYLGGSSGVNSPDVGVSTGFAVSVFKDYGNIAGDALAI